MSNKGYAQVIYFCIIDACLFQRAINGRSDVSDQQRISCFGNKNMFAVLFFGPDGKILIERVLSCLIERNRSLTKNKFSIGEIVKCQIRHLADAKPCL